MRDFKRLSACFTLAIVAFAGVSAAAEAGAADALEAAGANRSELEKALAQVPADERASMEWLLAHMPPQDAASLSADFLLTHVDQAYKAWKSAPWSAQVSEALYRDAILPYASVSEKRECWMPDMRVRRLPMLLCLRHDDVAAAPAPVDGALRLFHAAGATLSLRLYPGRDDVSRTMLADVNRWVMDGVCGAAASEPARCAP